MKTTLKQVSKQAHGHHHILMMSAAAPITTTTRSTIEVMMILRNDDGGCVNFFRFALSLFHVCPHPGHGTRHVARPALPLVILSFLCICWPGSALGLCNQQTTHHDGRQVGDSVWRKNRTKVPQCVSV